MRSRILSFRPLAFAVLCALLPLAACGGEPCEDTIVEEVTAPDEPWVAAVMTRVCDEDAVGTVEGVEHAFLKAVLMRPITRENYGEDPLEDALFIVKGDWPIEIFWTRTGWFTIDFDGPPDKLLKWSGSYANGMVLYD